MSKIMLRLCLLVLIVPMVLVPVHADGTNIIGVYITDEYRQTGADSTFLDRVTWGGVAGPLDGSVFEPSYSRLNVQSPFGSTYALEASDEETMWETEVIADDFGDPFTTPAVFRAYDADGNPVGTAEWTIPSEWDNGGPVPAAAPRITGIPVGSFWSNGTLFVQENVPVSLSFNAGAWTNFENNGETRLDCLKVFVKSDLGDEEFEFYSVGDFDVYDPDTGIATVTLGHQRSQGKTYEGWIEFLSGAMVPEGYGSTSGELDGYTLVGSYDKILAFDLAVVPEPSGVLALMGGLGVLGGFVRRRK